MVVEQGLNEESKLHILVGKVLTDPKFAIWLERDPKKALQSIGIEDPTDEMIRAIRENKEALVHLHRAFGGSLDYH